MIAESIKAFGATNPIQLPAISALNCQTDRHGEGPYDSPQESDFRPNSSLLPSVDLGFEVSVTAFKFPKSTYPPIDGTEASQSVRGAAGTGDLLLR
jgi:hypothetical protein